MKGPAAALLGGDRLHLQHGPIDLILGADAETAEGRDRAYAAARTRFQTILTELVSELTLLRSPVTAESARPQGTTARRMHAAALPHARDLFVTPMAAVAGAVADEVLQAMIAAAPLTRAYVNDGGDIALHLSPGQIYRAQLAGLDGADLGRIELDHAAGIGGIATSGRGGRSLSLGIADSVTVLARDAASADVAAPLIANAVTLDGHPQIRRQPARELDPDSDLGAREAVVSVGCLNEDEIGRALDTGRDAAGQMLHRGLIAGASLSLRGAARVVGARPHNTPNPIEMVEHV